MSTRTLGAIIHPDFELLDLYGPLEMFGALGPERINIVVVAQQAGPVRSSAGPQTLAEHSFDSAPPLDLLVLPGGIGTLAELENPAMLEFLRTRAQKAERVMSVCTGSALLARAGVLDGRAATSNKQFFDLARSQSDAVQWAERARWVRDGDVYTASGVSAGTDMALAVIADLFGEEEAHRLCAYTEYTWHTDADEDPFADHLNELMGVLQG